MTLSVGPVAVASLTTASAVTPLAAPRTGEYLLLSMLLALIGGFLLPLPGLLRLGFVASLLSHTAISGFVTGSAILITLGQLKPLLGIPAHGETARELVASLLTHEEDLNAPTATLGPAGVLLLWAFRRFFGRGTARDGYGCARG